MARAKDEIRESIINQLPAEWNLTDSDAALWKAFVNAITSAIYIFELIMDSFKADIEQKIDAKRIGSKDWYIQKVKEFQVDSQLQFFDDGTIGYAEIDTTKQIIAFVTIKDGDDAATLKVAKMGTSGQLEPLTDVEQLQLINYLELIKIVGTKFNVVSLPPDLITINADVYYNPIYNEQEVQDKLGQAIIDFQVQNTSGYFRRNEFIEFLRSYDEFKDIQINSLIYTQGENTGDIGLEYEIISGYFNWSDSCQWNLIPKYD